MNIRSSMKQQLQDLLSSRGWALLMTRLSDQQRRQSEACRAFLRSNEVQKACFADGYASALEMIPNLPRQMVKEFDQRTGV